MPDDEEYILPTTASLAEEEYLYRWDGRYDMVPLIVSGSCATTCTITTTNAGGEVISNHYALEFSGQATVANQSVHGHFNIQKVLPPKIRFFYRFQIPTDEANWQEFGFDNRYYDGTHHHRIYFLVNSSYGMSQVFQYFNSAGGWSTITEFTSEWSWDDDNWIELTIDADFSTGTHPNFDRIVLGNKSVTNLVGNRAVSAGVQYLSPHFNYQVNTGGLYTALIDEFWAKELI